MLLFASDLHLHDTREHTPTNINRFVDCVGGIVRQAAADGVCNLTIVLLGDIFELLKSKSWIEAGARPWDNKCTERHMVTVDQILSSIIEVNRPFFDGLTAIANAHTFVRLVYIPGNHDRSLNSDMGALARKRLRSVLPLSGEQETFDDVFQDGQRHRVFARHGHEWDPNNRYTPVTAAIGDAIVIEILTGLPIRVAQALGLPENHPDLGFLHKVDKVRPHDSRTMALWISKGLKCLGTRGKDVRQALITALSEVADAFTELGGRCQFETLALATWWQKLLAGWLGSLIKHINLVELALFLPVPGESPDAYEELADLTLSSAATVGGDYRYFLCGHTHGPRIVPLHSGPGNPRWVYFNTGTWCRVHQLASDLQAGPTPQFASWEEESLVVVHDGYERPSGLPPYEFLHATRGIEPLT